MRLYLAGPLFTEGERAYNLTVRDALVAAGHEVFLPQEHEADTSRKGYAQRCFFQNLDGLRWADGVVAVLDGSDVDSGTAWECGSAYGEVKPVFGLRSDFRMLGPEEVCNLMIEQACFGGVWRTMAGLLSAIRAWK